MNMSEEGGAPAQNDKLKRTVFVGNLNFRLTEKDLDFEFGNFGKIVNIEIPKYPDSGKTKGFAFIEFEKVEDAQEAIDKKHLTKLEGREISVEFAGKGPKRPRRDGGGGGRGRGRGGERERSPRRRYSPYGRRSPPRRRRSPSPSYGRRNRSRSVESPGRGYGRRDERRRRSRSRTPVEERRRRDSPPRRTPPPQHE